MCDKENTRNDPKNIWKEVDHGWLSSSFTLDPNTLVVKRGRAVANTFLLIVTFLAVLFGFVILTNIPYDAFPSYYNDEGKVIGTGVFFQSLFKIALLVILGYTFGQSGITGQTKKFWQYLYGTFIGTLLYGLGWGLFASPTWSLKCLGYILLGAAGLSFFFSGKWLLYHRSEVGDWKKIGDLVFLNIDPFLSYDDPLQGDLYSPDPFHKQRFLVIESGDEVKLYERKNIVTKSGYNHILKERKKWLQEQREELHKGKETDSCSSDAPYFDNPNDNSPNAYGYCGTEREDEELMNAIRNGPKDGVKDEKTNDPLIEAQKKEMKNLLSKRLTRAERLIIVLYYYDGMTIKEIAEKLDLSETRVSQMHSSIVRRFNDYLK